MARVEWFGRKPITEEGKAEVWPHGSGFPSANKISVQKASSIMVLAEVYCG